MSAKKGKKEREVVEDGGISSLFFPGGKEQVRRILVDAIREARRKKLVTAEKLDELCSFREDKLPTCEEFEETPSKMTQVVFCRAACALGLKADEVLRLKVAGNKLKTIVAQMKEERAGLAAALRLGASKSKGIPNDRVAPVYAAIKILSEV